MQGRSEVEKDNWLLQHGGEAPRLPEPYKLLLQLRRLNISTYSGGLFNQPHYRQLEFEACMEAEAEIETMRVANLRMKAGSNG